MKTIKLIAILLISLPVIASEKDKDQDKGKKSQAEQNYENCSDACSNLSFGATSYRSSGYISKDAKINFAKIQACMQKCLIIFQKDLNKEK